MRKLCGNHILAFSTHICRSHVCDGAQTSIPKRRPSLKTASKNSRLDGPATAILLQIATNDYAETASSPERKLGLKGWQGCIAGDNGWLECWRTKHQMQFAHSRGRWKTAPKWAPKVTRRWFLNPVGWKNTSPPFSWRQHQITMRKQPPTPKEISPRMVRDQLLKKELTVVNSRGGCVGRPDLTENN